MSNTTNKVSLNTQTTEAYKFHVWMERINSLHLADIQAMDRAFLKVEDDYISFSTRL